MKRSRTVEATLVIILGLALTSVSLPSDTVEDIFWIAALGVGVSIGVATAIEASAGIGNLFRVDLLMIWALYGLTFFEWLFPQPGFNFALSSAGARNGSYAVFIGFAGLVIGRHLVRNGSMNLRGRPSLQFSSRKIFWVFVFATIIGYAHMVIAVQFDPIELLRQMALPRFWQVWARSRYGGSYSLLYELGLLIYLIPPIAGLIYARTKEFSVIQKTITTIILLLTFYYGFSSGTRNLFATYVITFVGTYFLVRGVTVRRALLVGIPMMLVLLVGMKLMLEFRNEGLNELELKSAYTDKVFVDYNLPIISQLTEVFPDTYEFLGLEVPYIAIIRPIPRIFWPEKPEGLSVSIETALNSNGQTTIACTFVGEAYVAGGFFAVLIAGLLFGAAAGMWNRLRDNSPLERLLYASGFICAAVAMRSMLSVVPLMLPSLALWLFMRVWGRVRAPRHSASTVK